MSGMGGGVGEMGGRVMVGFRRGIGGAGGGVGDGGAASSLFGGRFGGTVAKGLGSLCPTTDFRLRAGGVRGNQ